jgi:hypothetical protein
MGPPNQSFEHITLRIVKTEGENFNRLYTSCQGRHGNFCWLDKPEEALVPTLPLHHNYQLTFLAPLPNASSSINQPAISSHQLKLCAFCLFNVGTLRLTIVISDVLRQRITNHCVKLKKHTPADEMICFYKVICSLCNLFLDGPHSTSEGTTWYVCNTPQVSSVASVYLPQRRVHYTP